MGFRSAWPPRLVLIDASNAIQAYGWGLPVRSCPWPPGTPRPPCTDRVGTHQPRGGQDSDGASCTGFQVTTPVACKVRTTRTVDESHSRTTIVSQRAESDHRVTR